MFSTEDFAGWSKDHVLYMNVTTHIDGHPHDGMLKEAGFAGFPSIGFMDANGNLIARHTAPRTVPGLKLTAAKAVTYLALRKQANGGDSAARQHVFVQNLGLGRYTFASGSLAFAAERKGMSKELRRRARQSLTDLQYAELTRSLGSQRTKLSRGEYSKRYTELNVQFVRAGKIPSGYRASSVLTTVMHSARTTKDAELFGRAFESYKTHFGADPRYARAIEMYGKQLEALRN